jgi:hypothetical protein
MTIDIARLRALAVNEQYLRHNAAMATLKRELMPADSRDREALLRESEARRARKQQQQERQERHRRIRALPRPVLFQARPFRADLPFVLLMPLGEPQSAFWRPSFYLTGRVNSPRLLCPCWVAARLSGQTKKGEADAK